MTQDARRAARRSADWYHPGEIVVVARVPRGGAAVKLDMHAAVHDTLRSRAREHLLEDHHATRSFVFDAPGEQKSLAFLFYKLADAESPRAVKDAVEAVHRHLDALSGRDDVEFIGALPHLHMLAHEGYSGGSPGSFPRPVYPDQVPDGWKQRFYQPVNPRLDLARVADGARPVRVAVLDTRTDLDYARSRGEAFSKQANNDQLLSTVDWLNKHTTPEPRYEDERHARDQHHARSVSRVMAGEPAPYPVPDHGLFVAGLIHGVAPRAPITLEPVLDETGTGDLSFLLLGLERVLAAKEPNAAQLINLSLGFRPHPARLPAYWYGLPRPQDPAFVDADEMFDPGRDAHWVAANRGEIGRTVDLLEGGLRELGNFLSLNNCLVVAAAGNDSLVQVEAGQARFEPRLPARFNTVLGVAATTSDPRRAARYSNVGDEAELGDHVATFGGNASDHLEPEDGVVGVYAGEFPDGRPNETGWAYWSGTSFAAGIVSGIAANFWAVERTQQADVHAASVLADLHHEASTFGPYVPALRTPAIEVRGRWRR